MTEAIWLSIGAAICFGVAWLLIRSKPRPGCGDVMDDIDNYFTCAGCGSGPWHNGWAQIECGRGPDGKPRHRMPRNPLGGCCSGAD